MWPPSVLVDIPSGNATNHKCTVLHGIANAPVMQVTSGYKLIEAYETRALHMPRRECDYWCLACPELLHESHFHQ